MLLFWRVREIPKNDGIQSLTDLAHQAKAVVNNSLDFLFLKW